jgi:hypothetical protein
MSGLSRQCDVIRNKQRLYEKKKASHRAAQQRYVAKQKQLHLQYQHQQQHQLLLAAQQQQQHAYAYMATTTSTVATAVDALPSPLPSSSLLCGVTSDNNNNTTTNIAHDVNMNINTIDECTCVAMDNNDNNDDELVASALVELAATTSIVTQSPATVSTFQHCATTMSPMAFTPSPSLPPPPQTSMVPLTTTTMPPLIPPAVLAPTSTLSIDIPTPIRAVLFLAAAYLNLERYKRAIEEVKIDTTSAPARDRHRAIALAKYYNNNHHIITINDEKHENECEPNHHIHATFGRRAVSDITSFVHRLNATIDYVLLDYFR